MHCLNYILQAPIWNVYLHALKNKHGYSGAMNRDNYVSSLTAFVLVCHSECYIESFLDVNIQWCLYALQCRQILKVICFHQP